MSIFNLDGSAIFGPGSEWFWSMAQFILVAVTLIGIYYQVRVGRAANAFDQMDKIATEFDSERMLRHRLEILESLQEGVNLADIPEGAAGYVANFWERVAALVREGHVDRKTFYQFLGSGCRYWWAVLAPNTRRVRIELTDPQIGEHHEWLAGVMAHMNPSDVTTAFDDAHVFETLDKRVQTNRDRLRAAEELRAVIIRRPARESPVRTPIGSAKQVQTRNKA